VSVRRLARRALLGWSLLSDGDAVAKGALRGTIGAGTGTQAMSHSLVAGARRASCSAPVVVLRGEAADGGRSPGGLVGGRLAAGARCTSSSAPVGIGGRKEANGGSSCRRLISAATTAARAPRGAHLPWLIRGSRGPPSPQRGRAPPHLDCSGGSNDMEVPAARRRGAVAPLQDFRSSAAAPPDDGCFKRQASFPKGVWRRHCLSPPSADDVGHHRRGPCPRWFRLPLAWTGAPRRGLS